MNDLYKWRTPDEIPKDGDYVVVEHIYMDKLEQTICQYINGMFLYNFYTGTGVAKPVRWRYKESMPFGLKGVIDESVK